MDTEIRSMYIEIVRSRDWSALRQWRRKYPAESRELARDQMREWRKANPERARKMGREQMRRFRARKSGLPAPQSLGPDTSAGAAHLAACRAFNQADPRGGA
jgi:hypothetical protein